jgi:hypothetical protein
MHTPQEHSYSDKYPPVNRTATGLGTVEIRVNHATGYKCFDPNSATLAAHSGPVTLALALGEPCTVSQVSGKPGYLYRNDKVELALTAEEICRLFMSNLHPAEFLAIVKHVGVFYEISGGRYDENTGTALSPRYSYAEQDEHQARATRPQLFILDNDKGLPRPHSIMAFDVARDLRLEYAKNSSRRAYVLDLVSPSTGAALDAFENIVVLRVYENGRMEAYGPFNNIEDAEGYCPAEAPGPAIHITAGVVSSAYVE